MKLVITKPGCKQFANRLLNEMSIYAYGLEIGARMSTPFAFSKILQALYARYVRKVHAPCVLDAWRPPVYLPPTAPLTKNCDALYFFGWVFRNPQGLEKYRKELLATYAPSLKKSNNIGVHIRTKPYPGFPEGEFLISKERTLEVADEYIRQRHITNPDVIVVFDEDKEGFWRLAQCSVVIGTNSTSANLPAWFANAPHIVATAQPIDWPYYRDKENYFDNKYATFAHGLRL